MARRRVIDTTGVVVGESSAPKQKPAGEPSGDLGGWLGSWLTGIPEPVMKVGKIVIGAMMVQWLMNGGSFQSSKRRR